MELIATTDIFRFTAALVFVLALMGGLAVMMKHVNAGRYNTIGVKRRLRIREILPLDGRRRLVLIQRDDTQHLVILGPNGETVVETGIESLPEAKIEETSPETETDKNDR